MTFTFACMRFIQRRLVRNFNLLPMTPDMLRISHQTRLPTRIFTVDEPDIGKRRIRTVIPPQKERV